MMGFGHRWRGFTMLELLVTVGVGSLLVLAALWVVVDVGSRQRRLESDLEIDRRASRVMRALRDDLSVAVGLPAVEFEESSADWPLDRMAMHALMSPAQQNADEWVGDLCGVIYQVGEVAVGESMRRGLLRRQLDSGEIVGILDGHGGPLLDQPVAGEPLADGVVAFEARPVCMDESGDWVNWSEGCALEAVSVRLVLARRGLAERLDRAGAVDAKPWFGDPALAHRHPGLRVCQSVFTLGHHQDE